MRKIFLFMNVSLDGYFEAPGHDLSWSRSGDFEAFSPEQGEEVDTLLFGRKTYEMFRQFWPTEEAYKTAPQVAEFINQRHKVVVSRSPFESGWHNVTVISGEAVPQVKQLKEEPGKTIAIFGSNRLCVSLLEHKLLDEFQLMLNPVVLGAGTSLFTGLAAHTPFQLAALRQFPSGNVLLTYRQREEQAGKG
ncbi:MAG TPA: dihydrofolate reductase family protein [Chloroflexia bacterium]|nr:dihydrofolate reductase family protein [Chloroflexia bacterium]